MVCVNFNVHWPAVNQRGLALALVFSVTSSINGFFITLFTFHLSGLHTHDKTSSIEELMKTGKIYVKDIGSVRTDYSDKDSYQKVVCFCHDGSRMLTGGIDGVIRVWKVSNV